MDERRAKRDDYEAAVQAGAAKLARFRIVERADPVAIETAVRAVLDAVIASGELVPKLVAQNALESETAYREAWQRRALERSNRIAELQAEVERLRDAIRKACANLHGEGDPLREPDVYGALLNLGCLDDDDEADR